MQAVREPEEPCLPDLVLGHGAVSTPMMLPGGPGDQVTWSEHCSPFPGDPSREAPWREACLKGSQAPSCILSVLLFFPSVSKGVPKFQDAMSLEHG